MFFRRPCLKIFENGGVSSSAKVMGLTFRYCLLVFPSHGIRQYLSEPSSQGRLSWSPEQQPLSSSWALVSPRWPGLPSKLINAKSNASAASTLRQDLTLATPSPRASLSRPAYPPSVMPPRRPVTRCALRGTSGERRRRSTYLP